ncbi:hypothetical protein GBA65_15120 [Rubrobacter marinus]|uniref:HNH endonuclease n=1 Tax=Rubrobacter marinus TaxID=2653852 RepID=A0A6G8PZL8_9ACTN|nr:hypothetical protein [Rubrobacter marinus]QIN79635.1 hypothetical protein GBA65_15120 [Rubrobacter marinus]
MAKSQPVRDWGDANRKMEAEGCCRNCGGEQELQRAHLVPRRYDPLVRGPRGARLRYVPAAAICPLCLWCHADFDRGNLSLLGKLFVSELRYAIRVLGKHRARRRLGGRRLG